MSCSNEYLATITASDGFETCHVSFLDLVSAEGALVGIPSVVSSDAGFVVSGVTLNNSRIFVNGVEHPTGTLLQFRVDGSAAEDGQVGTISVSAETALSKKKECYRVNKEVACQVA